MAIKHLEAEVGEALLIRQPRGMVPTRAGEFVLSETQQINRHVSRLNKLDKLQSLAVYNTKLTKAAVLQLTNALPALQSIGV